jgi:hypothetical protein
MELQSKGVSGWAERAFGPKPRWYVYVAAFICASVFADLAGDIVIGGVDALVSGLGGPDRPLAWYGLVTGGLAGAIWGALFYWARRLRLTPIIWALAFVSAVMLAMALRQIIGVDALPEPFEQARRATFSATVLHVAVFWPVFLALAIPPRRAEI